MHAAVAGEEAEGQPAAVEAFGALGHEAAYVIAPEAESAQSDGEAAADGSLEPVSVVAASPPQCSG